MGKVKKRNASFIDDGDSSGAEAAPVKVSKKVKTSASGPAGAEKDDNGDTFWDVCHVPPCYPSCLLLTFLANTMSRSLPSAVLLSQSSLASSWSAFVSTTRTRLET